MSKDKISDYSSTANSNTDIAGINIDEGCAPSGINDAIRTLMAQLKTWQSGSQDVYIHPAGSASAPSITANGDTNTGIFFPAADTVGITTGGIERARVDSSGNLIINDTSRIGSARLSMAVNASTENLFAFKTTTNGEISALRGLNSSGSEVVALNYDTTNSALLFRTASSERMRLDASGNLGIGTTSPSQKLHVVSSGGQVARFLRDNTGTASGGIDIGNNSRIWTIYGDSAAMSIYDTTAGLERARIDSSGNLLVGTTSAGARVYAVASGAQQAVRGDQSTAGAAAFYGTSSSNSATGYVAYFTNSGSGTGLYISNTAAWQSTSDERLKTDIQDLNSTERLLQLRPVDYLWKSQATSDDPTKRSFGFIAQEVQEVFPELVGVSPDGMFSVEYTGLIAPLVKAFQELKAEFDAYKASHP